MAKIAQLEAATDKFYDNMGKRAEDIYFETSAMLKHFLQDKKGLYKTVEGGRLINIPIRYDENNGGWFVRGGTLNSDNRDAITSVEFPWKYVYGNATMLQVTDWENTGKSQIVDLMKEELYGAMETVRSKAATSFYTGTEGANDLTGLNACCNTTATTKYGGYTENDIESSDGTKVWTGNTTSTASVEITLAIIRARKAEADHGKGKNEEPDMGALHKDLYNHLLAELQTMQRYTSADSKNGVAQVGFTGMHFEGTDLYKDRYCPSGNMYLINSDHWGFRVNPAVLFKRGPWHVMENTAEDKTMKIYLGSNCVSNNRRAHNRQENLETS